MVIRHLEIRIKKCELVGSILIDRIKNVDWHQVFEFVELKIKNHQFSTCNLNATNSKRKQFLS